MSLAVSINTDIRDHATPSVEQLIANASPQRLAKIARQPLETFWRQHLKNFPRLPGRFAAFPPTGFGEQSSRSVHGSVAGEGVRLRAEKQGLNLRFHGGTIRPVNKKVLCFAIAPESYGKTPYDFGFTRRGAGHRQTVTERRKALQADLARLPKGKAGAQYRKQIREQLKNLKAEDENWSDETLGERLKGLFAFAHEVTFRPNPAIVPGNDQFAEVALAAAVRALTPAKTGGPTT